MSEANKVFIHVSIHKFQFYINFFHDGINKIHITINMLHHTCIIANSGKNVRSSPGFDGSLGFYRRSITCMISDLRISSKIHPIFPNAICILLGSLM